MNYITLNLAGELYRFCYTNDLSLIQLYYADFDDYFSFHDIMLPCNLVLKPDDIRMIIQSKYNHECE